MSQQFVKGRTDNHLTFAMVDATDFATPESAMSDIIVIRKYGKLKGDDTVYTVGSSGQGSLTNDIKHVGASSTGIYTIGLTKADLSDASAAWYDQYIFIMTATGAAQQTVVVDGGIWISDLSAIASDIRSDVSDMHSDLIVMSGILSDTYSALVVTQSAASDAASAAQQGNSRVLLVQSRLSDLDSRLVSDVSDILSAVRGNSDALSKIQGASYLSDIASNVWAAKYTANSAASSFGSLMSDILSRVAVTQSAASDAYSAILLTQSLASDAHSAAVVAQSLSASDLSDLRSAIAAGPAATVTASDISDIASAVQAILASDISDILSAAQQTNSRVLVVQSLASDAHSAAIVAQSLSASDLSDIRSAIAAGPAATVTASDISDIASAVQAILASDISDILSAAQQTNSRVLVVQSMTSDAHSAAVVAQSLSASDLSDLASAVWAQHYNAHSNASSFGSLFEKMASSVSDLDSRVSTTPATKSQVASATFALFASHISDVTSAFAALSDAVSDLASVVTVTGVQLNASSLSDLRSAISAGPTGGVTVSDISDIASAVQAALASDLSDILSAATAIKAKTDGLTFTVANQVDANIQYVNDTAVTGDGAPGTEWGPA